MAIGGSAEEVEGLWLRVESKELQSRGGTGDGMEMVMAALAGFPPP